MDRRPLRWYNPHTQPLAIVVTIFARTYNHLGPAVLRIQRSFIRRNRRVETQTHRTKDNSYDIFSSNSFFFLSFSRDALVFSFLFYTFSSSDSSLQHGLSLPDPRLASPLRLSDLLFNMPTGGRALCSFVLTFALARYPYFWKDP